MDVTIRDEAKHFLREKRDRKNEAQARFVSLTILGNDFDRLSDLTAGQKTGLLCRIGRLLERERLKGTSGHWSYDLNRHIALKQLRDRLA